MHDFFFVYSGNYRYSWRVRYENIGIFNRGGLSNFEIAISLTDLGCRVILNRVKIDRVGTGLCLRFIIPLTGFMTVVSGAVISFAPAAFARTPFKSDIQTARITHSDYIFMTIRNRRSNSATPKRL